VRAFIMSADPSSSAGLPGRSRPVLSDLSKETTEEDLWNLDEETSGTPLPAPASAPPAETDSEKGEPKQPPVAPRVASGPGRQSKAPVVIEGAPERISAKAKISKPEPQRYLPTDTFDDLDSGSVPEGKATESSPAASPGEEREREEPVTYASYPEEEEDEPASVTDEEPQTGLKSLKISRRDLIGLSIFVFVLLLAGVWGLTSFFGLIQSKKDPRTPPKMPAIGKYATIAAQNTFWREPITEGPEQDRSKREVVILPVLELTLGSGASNSGALRVIFRDEKGRGIGDAVTRSFTGGKFETAAAATVAFPSTAGFEQMGTFNSYVSGAMEPWSARVLEGPSANAPADQFVPLIDVPISGFRR
jgi:hypothetical protein